MGLKNAGATCYMNAVFQQLFMQPSIRALVLGAREEPPAERIDSTFYQLQASDSLAILVILGNFSLPWPGGSSTCMLCFENLEIRMACYSLIEKHIGQKTFAHKKLP